MNRFCIFIGYLLFLTPLLATPVQAEPVSFQSVLERATAVPDSIIRYGAAESQFIELYLPSASAAPGANPAPAANQAPLVAFVHGGCWLNSFDIGHGRGLAEGIRDAGFAVALLEYRRLDDEGGGWPGSLNDIQQAITMLAENENANYDTNKITLMGHSAGGHLALLASAPEHELPIQAVVGLAAITDIEEYAQGESGCEQSAARFIATAPEHASAMNPVQRERHARVVLLQGEADTIVSREQTELAGADILHIPDAGHFDVVHPDTDAFSQVLQVLQQLNNSTENKE